MDSRKTYEAKMYINSKGLDIEHEIIGKMEG